MRPKEALQLLQMRKPTLNRTERVLARCVTIEDLREVACRRWPRGVRGYVEGGADAEVSLSRNQAAFAAFDLIPRILEDVSAVDTSCDILGTKSAFPFGLGPTGYTRMMHTDGERAVARAARAAGIPYSLSTMSTVRLEELAETIGGNLWFQLYMWRDQGLVNDLIDRADASGYRTLVITVDCVVTGQRVGDIHNGFTLPPRVTPSTVLDMARHPAWCYSLMRGEAITFANFAPEISRRSVGVMEFAARQFDASITWDSVRAIRDKWAGPLVIKGIVSPEDARRAKDAGADAVVLSNHGGRQLDQARPPIEALPEARAEVGEDFKIFVDSGVRRGTDLAIALALGADACLVGRPYLYGLGAAGEAGVAASIRMLGDELRRAMQLLGVVSVAQLRAEGASLVRRRLPALPR